MSRFYPQHLILTIIYIVMLTSTLKKLYKEYIKKNCHGNKTRTVVIVIITHYMYKRYFFWLLKQCFKYT